LGFLQFNQDLGSVDAEVVRGSVGFLLLLLLLLACIILFVE